MLSFFAFAAVAAAEPPAPTAPKPSKMETKSCREMLMSSSRLGVVKVCKTRAEWRRWEACHSSVTRYCNPKKTEVKVVGLAPADKLQCRYIHDTGSRIAQQRMCATKGQWEAAQKAAEQGIVDVQNQPYLVGTQTIFRNRKDLSEPQ